LPAIFQKVRQSPLVDQAWEGMFWAFFFSGKAGNFNELFLKRSITLPDILEKFDHVGGLFSGSSITLSDFFAKSR